MQNTRLQGIINALAELNRARIPELNSPGREDILFCVNQLMPVTARLKTMGRILIGNGCIIINIPEYVRLAAHEAKLSDDPERAEEIFIQLRSDATLGMYVTFDYAKVVSAEHDNSVQHLGHA